MNLNQPISRVLLPTVLVVAFASQAMAQTSARPSAPARLAAAAGQDGSVNLTWADRSSNETGFRITRQPAFPEGDQVVPANQTTFVDHPGTGRFTYRVAAFNDSGRSAFSGATRVQVAAVQTTTPATAPATTSGGGGGGGGGATDGTITRNGTGYVMYGIPNAPSNLTATPGTNQIVLDWNDNSNNEIFFEVQKQTQVGTSWSDSPGLQVWTDNITATDSVTPGTYRYRVRAAQYAGYSAYTAWVTSTVVDPAAPPAAPSGLTVTDAGSGRALVSWVDNANNETSYKIERNPAFAAGIITLNANTTSYLDACGNGSFSYRVRTANAAGTSTPTGWVAVNITSGSTGGGGGGGGGSGGGGSGEGWTSLTPPAGAQVFYVAANGSDSNAGTETSPFRTLSRGYGALRANQPDQVLLRCGDTFTDTIDLTKAANSMTNYMVIGSYGTGPRPKIRSNATPFLGGEAPNLKGLAIVGLDIGPAGQPDQGASGFWFSDGWSHLLIEDCMVAGYPVNITSHAIDSGNIIDFKIRRNVIVDSNNPYPGHSQNMFLGSQQQMVIEGNVLDRAGRTGEQTIFKHNVYIHDENALPCIFRENITARACATGVQVRPGGTVTNNLSLQNPVGFTWGGNGVFSYNVAIDGRDINSVDGRGIAFSLAGSGTVEFNAAAHQITGTGITAFNFESFNSGTVRNNYVYDWRNPGGAGWATAVQWDGGSGTVVFENNKVFMPNVGMVVRHESRPLSSQFTYRNNTYWTSTPTSGVGGYQQFAVGSGAGREWSGWRNDAGETGSTFLGSAPTNPNITVAAYLTSIGVTPGSDPMETFMVEARKQSRQNWRPQFTADAFNDWARQRIGMTANP